MVNSMTNKKLEQALKLLEDSDEDRKAVFRMGILWEATYSNTQLFLFH